MYLIDRILSPEIFQGKYKKKNYFEGWYYKLIDREMENVFAIIPGVSFDKERKACHSFIQILDARECKVNYLKYDINGFKFNPKKFEIVIGDNYFSREEIKLNILDKHISVRGKLNFENIISYPKSIFRPGIMGPYAFVPFMECYHNIVNIHHQVLGEVNVSGKLIDFSKGYGYIEKDWGKSFPEAWIWLQSNHFTSEDVSLMFSVAKIPWLGKYFIGLISFIRISDKMYNFSTYTKAVIVHLSYIDSCLKVILKDSCFKMEINAVHGKGGILKAPKNGLMDREILESITAVVRVKLVDRNDQIVYEGEGKNTGLEIVKEIFSEF